MRFSVCKVKVQENLTLVDKWKFLEGSNSLENNRLGGFTQASRHSTALSETFCPK